MCPRNAGTGPDNWGSEMYFVVAREMSTQSPASVSISMPRASAPSKLYTRQPISSETYVTTVPSFLLVRNRGHMGKHFLATRGKGDVLNVHT